MKAVIVEIKDSFAAVLSDDGCITKVRNDNYVIGQVINMKKKKLLMPKKFIAAAASVAMLLLFGGVGAWAYTTPYSYVSMDVNPSIEYTLNRFDRVLKVKAVNDDGQEILDEIKLENLENETIKSAIEITVDKITELGYFEDPVQGGLIITTAAEDTDKADELADDLKETVQDITTENGDNVEVEALSVGLDRVEEARKLGVTPGKLNLVQKLQAAASDPNSINIEEWLNKPVKDIMKATKEYKKGQTTTDDSGSTIIIKEKDSDDDDSAKVKGQKVQDKEKAEKGKSSEETLDDDNDKVIASEEKGKEKSIKSEGKDKNIKKEDTEEINEDADEDADEDSEVKTEVKENEHKTKDQDKKSEEDQDDSDSKSKNNSDKAIKSSDISEEDQDTDNIYTYDPEDFDEGNDESEDNSKVQSNDKPDESDSNGNSDNGNNGKGNDKD